MTDDVEASPTINQDMM
jgi:hypothetical protein